jgi:hypothetical protein
VHHPHKITGLSAIVRPVPQFADSVFDIDIVVLRGFAQRVFQLVKVAGTLNIIELVSEVPRLVLDKIVPLLIGVIFLVVVRLNTLSCVVM